MTNAPNTVIDETFDLAQVSARADALLAIYSAEPQRFSYEKKALARAIAHLDELKTTQAEAIARRDDHVRLLEDARRGGALNSSEWKRVSERLEREDAVPNLIEAQQKYDQAEAAFWLALKTRERELAEQPPSQ